MTAFLDVGVGNGSSGVTGFPQPTSPPVTFEPPRGLGGEPLVMKEVRMERMKEKEELRQRRPSLEKLRLR